MKSMLKKHIAMLLCLCLCLSLFPAAYAEDYEQVLTETDEALPEINDYQTDEEIVQAYPEDETVYEEVLNEAELPDEVTDTVLETPEEEDLAARLETVFAGITIPEIEQNEIPAGTVRRSNVSAAATLFTAENYGDGLCPVLFYTEKGYDPIGLVVADSAGKVLEPAATDGGWTYLLVPGAYTYRYHDDRAIFADLEETGFTVDGALEIPLDLTAAFEETFSYGFAVNPIYEDVIDIPRMPTREEALDQFIEALIEDSEQNTGSGSFLRGRRLLKSAGDPVEDAAGQLRSGMAEREETVTVTLYGDEAFTEEYLEGIVGKVFYAAFQHDGNHCHGDALWLVWGKVEYSIGASEQDTGGYKGWIKYTITYYTNLAQEEIVRSVVDSMAACLAGLSDYQKAYAINQWLYQNVDYDDERLEDESYKLKYTDYAALIDRTAVCQGFAVAFYRLALAAGLDARTITSSSMKHAWNIVKIDDVWYELDATWDSNRREDNNTVPYYFLRGSTWWSTGHGNGTIGDQFDYSSTNPKYDPLFSTYTLSQADYATQEPGTYIVSYNANGGDSAPGSQVKIHGTDLTLTTERPTRADTPETRYYLTLNANGGTIEVKDNPPAPSKRYYRDFSGKYSLMRWNTKSNKTGTDYAPGGIYSENASMELFAVWGRTYPHVSLKTLSVPTREGYRFKGWGTTSTATEIVNDNYTMKTTESTLYAVWEIEQYTVSFETDGGSAVASQTVTYGEHAVKPADPTKAASWFAGWYTETAPETAFDFANTAIKGDTTLYAVWVQPDFVMPGALTDIEAEAFAGCAFTFVKLSENTVNIGSRAFADCPNLKYIYIPEGAAVDETAFENVEGLTVFRSAA